MDKINRYKKISRDLVLEIAALDRSADPIQTAIVTDDEHGHYLLLKTGWFDNKRLYGPYLHLEVQDAKILVQQNGTDVHIAQELVDRGVSKDDIVLAFQMPAKRAYSGYAVS